MSNGLAIVEKYVQLKNGFSPRLVKQLNKLETLANKTNASVLVSAYDHGTILREIEQHKEDYGLVNLAEIAQYLNMSVTTLHVRIKISETYTREEVVELSKRTNKVNRGIGLNVIERAATFDDADQRKEVIDFWCESAVSKSEFAGFISSLQNDDELEKPVLDDKSNVVDPEEVRTTSLVLVKKCRKAVVTTTSLLGNFGGLEIVTDDESDQKEINMLLLELKSIVDVCKVAMAKLNAAVSGPYSDKSAAVSEAADTLTEVTNRAPKNVKKAKAKKAKEPKVEPEYEDSLDDLSPGSAVEGTVVSVLDDLIPIDSAMSSAAMATADDLFNDLVPSSGATGPNKYRNR